MGRRLVVMAYDGRALDGTRADRFARTVVKVPARPDVFRMQAECAGNALFALGEGAAQGDGQTGWINAVCVCQLGNGGALFVQGGDNVGRVPVLLRCRGGRLHLLVSVVGYHEMHGDTYKCVIQ